VFKSKTLEKSPVDALVFWGLDRPVPLQLPSFHGFFQLRGEVTAAVAVLCAKS
jgi:hypothetical protein